MLEIDEDTQTGYTREGIKMVLEEQEDSLVITYADLNVEDTYHLVILLLDRLSQMSGIPYNEVLEDLKEEDG